MSFDLAFNFRQTSSFVTDQSFAVPVLGDAYPHTYTNGNGQSINAGWVSAPFLIADRDSALDPRLAGGNGVINSAPPRNFQIDLFTGSSPGSGGYTVSFSHGDHFQNNQNYKTLLDDNGATLLTFQTTSLPADQYTDATNTQWSSSAWPGSNLTASVTFASTVCSLINGANDGGSNYSIMRHFRLTLQTASAVPQHLLMLMGVGA